MTMIKICGITTEETAKAVAEYGADYMGIVFAPSPRQVSTVNGKILVTLAKSQNPLIKTVGVFVDSTAAIINKIADYCGLDWVQLSGNESWAVCREISRPFIKVSHINSNMRITDVIKSMEHTSNLFGNSEFRFLLDTSYEHQYGGTGKTFDWNIARKISQCFPVIIAGGLTIENVTDAISICKPAGVDVSSGVERIRGEKSAQMIQQFINKVRAHDAVTS